MKTWLSDIIKEEYKQWKAGNIVLIGTGTGSGKSYFIRNKLSSYAEYEQSDILFIFNRKELHKQNKEQIELNNNYRIHTTTYQEIEHQISNSGCYDFTPYTYIVCDECHYFTDDSSFNHNSDLSFNAIMRLNNKIRIFMSATGSTLFSFICNSVNKKTKVWEYRGKRQFNQVASLSFYSKDESVKRYIQQHFNGNEKIIWFCKSTKKAAKLHNEFPNSYFLCSNNGNNKKYLQLINDRTIITDGEKITFDRKYLFTTKVLDNGYDLKDEQIKLIICDEFDINTMIQCIGRKRSLSDDDKVHIVLFNYSNKSINGYKNVFVDKLKEADIFLKEGVAGRNEFIGRFAQKSNYIIYDQPSPDNKYVSDKKISTVKYLKVQNDLAIINEMLDHNRELKKIREGLGEKSRSDAYMMYILELMDMKSCRDLDKIYQEQDLGEYLDSLLGKRLYKQEQKELIERIAIKDYRGRIQKDVNQIDSYLRSNNLKYAVASFKDNNKKLDDGSDNPNRGKWYWLVSRFE
ncbi:hypothetical protein SAMN04487895_10353 [Paenibacillus sophorae]|nr:DNA/RNA helicase [Paenibacillus sophorae]SEN81033.1 hypothetical protein SAMN04487895_10353 [Paenibacillus sophorae]